MGRKRKQTDPSIMLKASLPPCRVCGAPGAGFHYGANTCEACKGFFHRSLKIWSQYTCYTNTSCIIEGHGSSKLCQKCRYLKCLSVGMAKTAIKTGRYTSVKRTKDILEVKRLQGNVITSATEDIDFQTTQTKSGNICNKGGKRVLNLDGQCGMNSSLCANAFDQSSSGCAIHARLHLSDPLVLGEDLDLQSTDNLRESVSQNKFVESETEGLDPRMWCGTVKANSLEKITSLHEIENVLSGRETDLNLEPYQNQQNLCSPSSYYTASSTTSPAYGLFPEGSASTASPNMLIDTGSTSGSSVYTTSPPSTSSAVYRSYPTTSLYSPSTCTTVTSPQGPSLTPSTTGSPSSSTTYKASPSPLHMDSQVSTNGSSNPDNDILGYDIDQSGLSELYSDKDMIVRTLMEADENSLVPIYGRMTDQEIKQQQMEHVESCRLKREMFGRMRRLPDHEYDYIFATTGLDADDRQKGLHQLGVCLEKMIRAMVKFCKAIPGFSKLSIHDKVQLIKYSRQEFYIFLIYKCIDSEKRILRGFDNQWKCENELSKNATDSEFHVITEHLDLYFRYCNSLQVLKLSYEELVMIRAIIVMSPDRDTPVDSPLAHRIYWQLTLCLIHLLSQRHHQPLIVYAKIMDRLTEARTQTASVISFLRKLRIDKYSDLMLNPLLKEMCGGIFFDYKDDDLFADT